MTDYKPTSNNIRKKRLQLIRERHRKIILASRERVMRAFAKELNEEEGSYQFKSGLENDYNYEERGAIRRRRMKRDHRSYEHEGATPEIPTTRSLDEELEHGRRISRKW